MPCCQQVGWASGRLLWGSTPGVWGGVTCLWCGPCLRQDARGQVCPTQLSGLVVRRVTVHLWPPRSALASPAVHRAAHHVGPTFPWLGERQLHLPCQWIFTDDLPCARPQRGAGDAHRNRPCCLRVVLVASRGAGGGEEPLRSPEARDHDRTDPPTCSLIGKNPQNCN